MSLWEDERRPQILGFTDTIDITQLPVAHPLETLVSFLIPRVDVAHRIGLNIFDFGIGQAQENAAIKVVPILPKIDPLFTGKLDPLLIILQNNKNEHPYGPFNAVIATAVGMLTKALQDERFYAYFQARRNNTAPFSADSLLNRLRVRPETLFLFWVGLQSATILTNSPTLRSRIHPKAKKIFDSAAAQIIQDMFDISGRQQGVSPQHILPAIKDDMRTLLRVHESFQPPLIPSAFLMQPSQNFDADQLRDVIHQTRAGYFHLMAPMEALLENMRYITTEAYYNPVVQ